MERYTIQQRVEIIKIYYRNSESVASTLRALRPIYGRHNRPARSTIEHLVEKNMRYWSGSNPHELHESTLHPEKITVWCGLWAGGVIGPYFFRDDQDRHVTVNGNRYRSMITEYFWPELDDMDLDNMWFQQDGATSHTANVTIDLLKTKFGERVISRNGPVNWPPRSCDLTPLDYFLWGYVKSMVYANKPATIDELRTNIEREIAAVSAKLCLKTVENWVQRLDFCKRARGGHAKEIEFHT